MTDNLSSMAPIGLILYHGAGGSRDDATLEALEHGLELPVRRINFPYRQQNPGRRPPDRMPKLVAAIVDDVAQACNDWGCEPSQILLGGRSMGGRAASVAHAEGLECAGLVLLSYPLHPQGKPDKLRIDHLGLIRCPTLLVQGTKDPLGSVEEFERHLSDIRSPLTRKWLEGANHSPKNHIPEIVSTVSSWIGSL